MNTDEKKEGKLKTFRDLETFYFAVEGHSCRVCNTTPSGDFWCDCEGVEINQLKELLIKWLKEDKQCYPNIYSTIDDLEAIRRWIKYFFNISEKDILE